MHGLGSSHTGSTVPLQRLRGNDSPVRSVVIQNYRPGVTRGRPQESRGSDSLVRSVVIQSYRPGATRAGPASASANGKNQHMDIPRQPGFINWRGTK